MISPIEANYSAMRARSLSQFNNWPLYQSVLRHRLGRSVQPFTTQLAGELEQARVDDVSVLRELVGIYKTSPGTQLYYEKHPQEKLRLPDVYRFETVLTMHRDLLAIRNELADGSSISIGKLRWMEGIVNDAGWLSGNFGITELARNIRNVVNVVHSRHPSQDLQEANRILNLIVGASVYYDANLPSFPVGFSRRLLTGGIELFARLNRAKTIDKTMLGRWAKSIVRHKMIPDMIQSSKEGAAIPTETILKALKTEWKHYNEYLIRQYDNEFRETYPEITFYHYTYKDGDEDHRAIYNETWDAYDLIYGLESAAAELSSSDSRLLSALSERLSFLTELVSEYAMRIKRGEQVHSKFRTSTTRLSETPELEELFVLAKTLRSLAPDGVVRETFDYLHNLIMDEEINFQDRGHILWRMEDLFDTTTPMGINEFIEFSVQVSSANVIPMEPPIRKDLSECETFAERIARQWATREVDDLLRKIQDVKSATAARIRAIQMLRRWGAAAEIALPVLAQFESALPDSFDIENDPLTSGAHALFNRSKLTSTILYAREAHTYIQGCMQMKGWG